MNRPSVSKEMFSTDDLLNRGVTGLVAGTLVTTPDGDKRIEEIKAGDWVLSGRGNDKAQLYKVKGKSKKAYCGSILHITADSHHQFSVTPNHVCFGFSKEVFNTLEHREPFVNLIAFAGTKGNSLEHFVGSLAIFPDKIGFRTSNNIDFADADAIKMSNSNGGLDILRTALFCSERGFLLLPAMNLKIGVEIPVESGTSVKPSCITSIVEDRYEGFVYALDVPKVRNFAANGILVHDSTLVQF